MKDASLQLQQANEFTRPYQFQSLLAELEPRNADVTQRLSVEIANRFMDDGVTNREALNIIGAVATTLFCQVVGREQRINEARDWTSHLLDRLTRETEYGRRV
jgi:hypothetical protein